MLAETRGHAAREGYEHTPFYDPRLVKNRFGGASVTACTVRAGQNGKDAASFAFWSEVVLSLHGSS